ESERFRSAQRGEWTVVFVKHQGARKLRAGRGEGDAVVHDLVELGMTDAVAKELARRYDEKRIREKVALVRWLSDRKDRRVSQNPAGFLYSAIVKDYEPPADFVRSLSVTKEAPAPRKLSVVSPKAPRKEKDRRAIDAYWAKLSAAEQAKLEEEAV